MLHTLRHTAKEREVHWNIDRQTQRLTNVHLKRKIAKGNKGKLLLKTHWKILAEVYCKRHTGT